MVNFVIIVDVNKKRRLSYIKTIEPQIAPVKGLTTSTCASEEFHAVWASGDWTPVSYVADPEGAAIIFGDAIPGPGPTRLSAEQLRHLWNRSKLGDALDGFHVAVVYNPDKGLIVGADLLGVFPVYYYTSDEVILVGSSPELFQYHPCFELKFNPKGLVGILLTKGLFEGQTLLRGVHLLTPGHIAMCRLSEPAREFLQFQLPASAKYFDFNLPEQVEILAEALGNAVARHLPVKNHYCLMLSGGLDSRIIAGYLKEKQVSVTAFTEGLPTDSDMRCATSVARTLGFEQFRFDMGYADYPHFADLAVTWRHLSDGFTGIATWGYYRYLRRIAERVVSGFLGNGIFGGLINWARPNPHEEVSFKTLFNSLNKWVIKPKLLRRLLKREYFNDLVRETLQRIEKAYESYAELEFQRVRCFGLNHRVRFHGGSVVWLLSFGSWPTLPFSDREILEVIGGMPIEALADRRLEKELLCSRFPNLAKIPLSRTTFDTTPLLPGTRHKVLQQVYGDVGIWRSRRARALRTVLLLKLIGETRYWSRKSYFNSQGWKTIRKKAEPHIELISEILSKDVVSQLLPRSSAGDLDVRLTTRRFGLASTSSLQILLGLALWLSKHQDSLDNFLASHALSSLANDET